MVSGEGEVVSGQGKNVAAEIRVEGRVQGVGFREFARRAAERAGLVGYAMNLEDGDVRIVVEGERVAIDAFAAGLEKGPRLGNVARVGVTWRAASGEFTSFAIRYSGRDA